MIKFILQMSHLDSFCQGSLRKQYIIIAAFLALQKINLYVQWYMYLSWVFPEQISGTHGQRQHAGCDCENIHWIRKSSPKHNHDLKDGLRCGLQEGLIKFHLQKVVHDFRFLLVQLVIMFGYVFGFLSCSLLISGFRKIFGQLPVFCPFFLIL